MNAKIEHEYEQAPKGLVNITSQAHVATSSSQVRHGPEKMVEDNAHSFWQSNGTPPHTITVRFGRSMDCREVWVFCNYAVDESYTPSKLELFVGTDVHDMALCGSLSLKEPVGWAKFVTEGGVNCHMLMVKIEDNHMGGKDSLVRGLRVWSQRPARSSVLPF